MQIRSHSIFKSYHLTFRLNAYVGKDSISYDLSKHARRQKRSALILLCRKKGH